MTDAGLIVEARKAIRERLLLNRIGLQMWREVDRDIIAMRKADEALERAQRNGDA